MLSLAKLAGSDQRYYLDQAKRRVDHTESVSSGAEDYYLSGPEAAGQWTGSAAGALELEGEVAEGALRAALSKHDPRSGQPLEGSVRRAQMPGFDLMFSVPKSASILFGIGDARIQRAVLDAQAAAVAQSLEYLEEHACRSRRGAGGCEIVPGDGFVGATFRHRTSRAGDPQIHTHVLVANATRIDDGTWAALDGRALYAEARTAGFVHEAVFRRELTQRLGVEWGVVRNGIAEVAGVPRQAVQAFSRRKAEIDAQVQAWGRDTAAARQSAAVQTRAGKDYNVTPERLAPEWRQRAAALGLGGAELQDLVLGHATGPDVPFADDVAERLLSSEGLTAQQSSFDRRDVVRGVAAAARMGAGVEEIEAFADRVLADREVMTLAEPGGLLRRQDVIQRRDGRVVSAVAANPRYSTVELLATEQRVIREATAGADARAGVAEPAAVEAAIARRASIGPDQAETVRRLCLDGAAVQVVVGPPGTGKTFALAAAREAWQRSGLHVYGAAVARRAAAELTASAGIEATSTAALLDELHRGAGVLDARSVLVIDEAGMLGTRPLAELAAHAREVGAKLVLVGDPAQLPEIDAGGAFRALAQRTSRILLSRNRRQERATDRRLLENWRAGELHTALTIATEQGDLILDATPEQAFTRLVADYCHALTAGQDAVMLAPRRAEVRRLNQLAREQLAAEGQVTGSALALDGCAFACGDRVVLRRNDRRLGVQNGTRATITHVNPRQRTFTVALADGTQRELPARYLQARTRRDGPAVEHGYALTAHLAQGMTVDRAFVLGSETVYREWGYVAYSRARHGTRFYVVEPEFPDEHHTAAPVDVDRFEEITRRLDRSEAQRVALDALDTPLPDRGLIAARHGTVSYLERALGPRPDRFRARRRWERHARRIERYRAHHHITDPLEPLGPPPPENAELREWRKAQQELTRAQAGLGHQPPGYERSLGA